MMSRKDYILFAEALMMTREEFSGFGDTNVLDKLEERLVRILSDDNPRFDAEKFGKHSHGGFYHGLN